LRIIHALILWLFSLAIVLAGVSVMLAVQPPEYMGTLVWWSNDSVIGGPLIAMIVALYVVRHVLALFWRAPVSHRARRGKAGR
jgi:hypothetical protein